MGCKFERHGGSHDIWVDDKGRKIPPVPRHPEVAEGTARAIIKKAKSK